MKVDKYIFIDENGDIVETGDSEDDCSESGTVCLHLETEIPDDLFKPPVFEMRLDIPEELKSDSSALLQWLSAKKSKK
jgi:hypothetical protein